METRPSGLLAKMAQLMYALEVSVLSASGLRAEDWKPSSTAEGLACAVVKGEELRFTLSLMI